MSQTNPQRNKAVLRNESPATMPSNAPPAPINHPLPQHPHTHIPPHLKRGGKPRAPEESPEIKALKAKFGKDKLATLKEIYPTWSDEDLLTTLSEANGSVDVAVTRIADGRAEQWDSVSRGKKDKKDKAGGGASAMSPQQIARDRIESGGSASPGRGGFRGGRGGGRGGLRGGRGGGRGGINTAVGKGGSAAPTPTAETPEAGGWGASSGDGWGTTTTTTAGGTEGWGAASTSDGWGPSAGTATVNGNGTTSKPAPAAVSKPAPVGKSPAPVPAGPPKLSWAQIAKPKPQPPKPVPPPPAPAQAPATIPVPPPVQIPTDEDGVPTQDALSAAAADQAPETAGIRQEDEQIALEAMKEDATTIPSDDWIHVSPPDKAAVELPSTLEVVPEPTAIGDLEPEKPAEPEPTPVPVAEPSESTKQTLAEPVKPAPVAASPISPPGLPALPQASQATTTAAPAPVKPSTPRVSSRAAHRHKTTDGPVVMPGGALPTTVFGNLTFGNAVQGSGFGGGSGPRFDMQFGSLSLNDDLGTSGPVEPAEEIPAPEPLIAKPPTPAPEPPVSAPPVTEREPTPPPAPVPVAVSVPPQAPAPQAPIQPQQPPQQSPRVPTSSHINALFQSQQPPSQPAPQPQQPPKVDTGLPPFGGLHPAGGAPGLLNHLQQQQAQQQASGGIPQHLQGHLPQQAASVSPATQPGQVPQLPAQQQQAQQAQQTPLSYAGHQLAPHLDTTTGLGGGAQAHPSVAAQSSYFRGAESPYGNFHAPTPPQTQLPHQLQQQQQDHSSPYGAFSPLGQQGGAGMGVGGGVGQLGGFGASPGVGAGYGDYDAQRGFYDAGYGQGSAFHNRGQEEAAKSNLPPSNPSAGIAAQSSGGLGQVPPGPQSAAGQQAPFGMMPYHYFQQPYFHPSGYNPYGGYAPKYPFQPSPAGSGGPGLQGKPPASAGGAGPYGSQHFPSQNPPYDDPSSGYPQQGATDYTKQQQLYGGGAGGNQLQNFFQQQNASNPNVPQLGGAGAGQGAGAQRGGAGGAGAGATPDNAYKQYNNGPADKGQQQQQPQVRGGAAGPGGQPQQQSGFYPNRYGGQPNPGVSQGYPQGDGQQQFYPPYQQQPGRYW